MVIQSPSLINQHLQHQHCASLGLHHHEAQTVLVLQVQQRWICLTIPSLIMVITHGVRPLWNNHPRHGVILHKVNQDNDNVHRVIHAP